MIGKQRAVFLAALLLAAGSLSACGDDDGGNGGTPPPAGSRLWIVADQGVTPLTTEQRALFAAGNTYANAHTSANPSGEIRGQLDSGATIRLAQLEGSEEVPAVSTNAKGAGVLAVDETTRAASGFVLTTLQSTTAAHIHVGAPGTENPPIITLQGGPEVWIVPDDATLTPEQLTAFLAGNLYFNVHTTANPDGEIRGQIDKSGPVRLASLNGAQEVPAVTTTAYGEGLISVDDNGEVAGFIITSGLVSPTAAHIHPGARGATGNPIVTLVGGPRLWIVPNDATVDAAGRTAFGAGTLYVNAHTTANPNGEIRGQVDKTGDLRVGAMTGAQEVPPVSGTTAIGAAAVAVDSSTGAASGFFATSGLVSPTVAHVHPGARGVTGSPIVTFGP